MTLTGSHKLPRVLFVTCMHLMSAFLLCKLWVVIGVRWMAAGGKHARSTYGQGSLARGRIAHAVSQRG